MYIYKYLKIAPKAYKTPLTYNLMKRNEAEMEAEETNWVGGRERGGC